MEIQFSTQRKSSTKLQKQNIVFGAGLTPKMMEEIQQTDVFTISKKLAEKGIITDFKGNKFVAWCCYKTVEIFEQLNKKFKQRLALPKGIFVEDFERLNINNPNKMSFCNIFPLNNLVKGSNRQFNGETLFFNAKNDLTDQNELQDWSKIDNIADYNYSKGISATDHFLDTFLHEFSHIAHEHRVLKKRGLIKLEKSLDDSKNKLKIESYKDKYGAKISKICNYALSSPFEAIACDMSRIISRCLDKERLILTTNPFLKTPYEPLSFWKRINIPYYTDEQRPLNEILRDFWNGKFD